MTEHDAPHARRRTLAWQGIAAWYATAAIAMLAGAAAVLTPVRPADAAETRWRNTVSAQATATDNVDLDPDDDAEEALVGTLAYDTGLRFDGNRVDAGLNGRLAFDQDTRGERTLDQNVRARGTAEVLENWFFLDASASSSRELVDNDAAVSATGRADDDDTETVNTISVSPALIHRFADLAEMELRARHTETFVTGDNAGDDDNDGRRIDSQSLRLETGRRFVRTRFGLDLRHQDSRVRNNDPGDNDDFEIYEGSLRGEYAVTRVWTALARAGVSDVDTNDSRDLDGPLWSVGVRATPGPDALFEATYGQRYDDDWVTARAEWERAERLRLSAEVSRSLTTAQTDLADRSTRALPEELEGTPLDPRGESDLDDDVALTWRARVRADARFGESRLGLSGSFVKREFETTEDTSIQLVGTYTRALSRRTQLNFRLLGRLSEDELGNDSRTLGERLEVSHRVTEDASVFGGVSRTDRFADRGADEFTENAAFAGVRVVF